MTTTASRSTPVELAEVLELVQLPGYAQKPETRRQLLSFICGCAQRGERAPGDEAFLLAELRTPLPIPIEVINAALALTTSTRLALIELVSAAAPSADLVERVFGWIAANHAAYAAEVQALDSRLTELDDDVLLERYLQMRQ